MAKKPKSITIPWSLALLLTAKSSELKDPRDYRKIHKLAKASLRLLMVAAKET